MRLLARAAPIGFALALAGVGTIAGCGHKQHDTAGQKDLTFDKLPGGNGGVDTIGLTDGRPLLEHFELLRMSNGALRVTAHTRFPEGTRLQVSLHDSRSRAALAMTQVTVDHGELGSPPFFGDSGPLPVGDYRVEILAHFTAEWQPAEVLRETGGGMHLRGPGITRSKVAGAAFFLAEEIHR